VLNAFRLIGRSNNLGDPKSLATHPATTTHMRIGPEERARPGITDGVIRLSGRRRIPRYPGRPGAALAVLATRQAAE
jgi:hypothetical protein